MKWPDRVALGKKVHEVWMAWAREQPAPKPSWLVPWDDLSPPEREVDMRIGEALAPPSDFPAIDETGAPEWWVALDAPTKAWIARLAAEAFHEGKTDVPSAAWKDFGYDPIKAAIARTGAPPGR